MAGLWRPFEEASSRVKQPAEGRTKMCVRVGENEIRIVMEAYLYSGNNGWNAVLRSVREKAEQLPLSSKVIDFYLDEKESSYFIRRMQRIVREETTTAAKDSRRSASTSTGPPTIFIEDESTARGMAAKVVDRQMRYAKKRTPVERRQEKLNHFVASSSEEAEAEAETPPKKKAKTIREATMEAQTTHTKMCTKALEGIRKMSSILDKLERKLDDM